MKALAVWSHPQCTASVLCSPCLAASQPGKMLYSSRAIWALVGIPRWQLSHQAECNKIRIHFFSPDPPLWQENHLLSLLLILPMCFEINVYFPLLLDATVWQNEVKYVTISMHLKRVPLQFWLWIEKLSETRTNTVSSTIQRRTLLRSFWLSSVIVFTSIVFRLFS